MRPIAPVVVGSAFNNGFANGYGGFGNGYGGFSNGYGGYGNGFGNGYGNGYGGYGGRRYGGRRYGNGYGGYGNGYGCNSYGNGGYGGNGYNNGGYGSNCNTGTSGYDNCFSGDDRNNEFAAFLTLGENSSDHSPIFNHHNNGGHYDHDCEGGFQKQSGETNEEDGQQNSAAQLLEKRTHHEDYVQIDVFGNVIGKPRDEKDA